MKKVKPAELLGQRVRSLRKAKGQTQEELGAVCGVNYKFIGGIERGEENPSLSILQKIAEGLEVELFDLFRFHPEEKDPARLKRSLIEMINRLEKDDMEKLQLVLRVVSAFR